MGEILIQGLGVIEIKGDAPDEAETAAILNALGREPRFEEGPAPEDIPVLAGEPVAPEEPVGELPPVRGEGPLGIVSPGFRTGVAEIIAGLPGLEQLVLELGPAAAGTLFGATVGGTFGGPPGAVGGAILGGLGGETIAQELGLAPTSEANRVLAALGPLGGQVAGGTLRIGRRIAGLSMSLLPPARAARARGLAQKATEAIESLGTRILSQSAEAIKKTVAGVGKVRARTASELYGALRRAGVQITPDSLKRTREGITALKKEMAPLQEFAEVKQAIKVLEQQERTLFSGPIDFEIFVDARRAMGAAIGAAERVGGRKLGTVKQAFRAMSEDLDDFAKAAPTKRVARLAQAATKRAKLEFAVRDMEQIIAKATKLEPGGDGVIINFSSIANKLRDLSNPKSKLFEKNFADALKDDLPAIIKNLNILAKTAKVSGPGGPGSLVFRGLGAGFGGAVGASLAGAGGAAVGALAGAQLPELMMAIFTSKAGTAFLLKAADLGKGEISRRAWLVAGQIALRSAGASEEDIQAFAETAGAPGTPAPSGPAPEPLPDTGGPQ